MALLAATEFRPGVPMVPWREQTRVQAMDRWAQWSNGDFIGIGTAAEQKGADFRRKPNVFQFVEQFFARTVIPRLPVVEYEGATDTVARAIGNALPPLVQQLRIGVRYLVRFGCAVFFVRPHAAVAWDPRWWYGVRSGDDWRMGMEDLVIQPWSSTDQQYYLPDRVTCWHTSTMSVEARRVVYQLTAQSVGEQLSQSAVQVGMPGVIVVRQGEGEFGESDFPVMQDAVAEIQRRESALSEALDEHVFPHTAVPEDSVAVGVDGSVKLAERGAVIPVPRGSRNPEYMVWENNFQAHVDSYNRAFDEVLRLVGIAPVLVDRFGTSRQVVSGLALQRLGHVTVARIEQLREALLPAVQGVVASILTIATGTYHEPGMVAVTWPPPLAGIADVVGLSVRAADAGLLDRVSGAQAVSDVTRVEAERIVREWLMQGGMPGRASLPRVTFEGEGATE